jgi:hypothetical protein
MPGVTRGIIDFTLDKFNSTKSKKLKKGYFDATRTWNDVIEWARDSYGNIMDLGPQVKPRNPDRPPGRPVNPAPGVDNPPNIDLDEKMDLDARNPGGRVREEVYQGPLAGYLGRTNPNHSFWLTKFKKIRRRRRLAPRMRKRMMYFKRIQDPDVAMEDPVYVDRVLKRGRHQRPINARKRGKGNRGNKFKP